MADNNPKNDEKVKKPQKQRARINYQKCHRCGVRKKEEDMSSTYFCNDCDAKPQNAKKKTNDLWSSCTTYMKK